MDRNFQYIQRVRRLVRDGRYDEARSIMKETNHPQIPALEKRMNLLVLMDTPTVESPRIVTKLSLSIGIGFGAFFALMALSMSVRNIPFLLICFGLAFGMGIVMPEYERRRRRMSDKYMQAFFKRLNSFQRH